MIKTSVSQCGYRWSLYPISCHISSPELGKSSLPLDADYQALLGCESTFLKLGGLYWLRNVWNSYLTKK